MSHLLNVINESLPWYAEGLRFKCTECGKCCTGSPGYAWVNDQEIISIANFLKISVEQFSKSYLRYVEGRYALLEKPVNYDCIFLKDKKCQIYSVRPTQCRTYPWWMQNLESLEDWKEAAAFCEGISSDAPLVSFDIIQEQLAKNTKISNEN